ncbi:PAS domain S-box-containing protein [Thiohalomonas denitrificans]|uniref:histidine kinase n=1 Tax=Thiohalomonas denitrificans TaxID=415747 RepID=A0A1G5Q952_9GAMM|nr:PAS domain S-box-containing protein [Thiohalomonas denitrificans]
MGSRLFPPARLWQVGLFAVLIISVGAVALGAAYAAARFPWIAALSVVVAVLAILATMRCYVAIKRIRQGLVQAREGLLVPVDTAMADGPFLRRFIGDYNSTIHTLGRMFSTVEECQARALNERNKMDAILQSLPGALLHISDDLEVASSNKTAEVLFGLPPEQLKDANLFDLLEVGEHDRDVLRDAFLYKRPVRNRELLVALDRGERWLSMNLAFINQHEADMGAVVTLQDVTDYRQLQDSVAIREKLVAMGQLAAGVAHELNTPLGNILGYSQLLRDSMEDEKLLGYAVVVADETKRCSRIVQDLLNYARQDQCSGDMCEIVPLVRELIDTFMSCRLKRHQIVIELDLPDQRLVIDGGCGQLDIVLTNLILNAIQAVSRVEEPRIRIGVREDDSGFIAIEVEDNGPGIPHEVRSRIFDPFFTTKDVGDGSGLGLSISQAMMVRRGGFIRYDPEYSDGARFVLRLPAVSAEYVQAAS